MKRLLTILWVFFLANLLHAQDGFWQELKSPYGGRTTVISTTTTGTLYANLLSSPKVFRSDDNGNNWQRLYMTEPDTGYDQKDGLVIEPSGRFYQILKYTNANWHIRKLFTSADEGQTWQLQLDSFPLAQIVALPSGALLGKKEGSIGGSDLFRSTDQGATWEIVYHDPSSSLASGSFTIQTAAGGRTILSISHRKYIFVTEDDGLTWTPGLLPSSGGIPPFILPNGTIITLRDNPGNFGVFRSEDGGSTWDTISINFEPGDYPSDLLQLNSGNLLLATDKHLYTSTDDGVNWQKLDDTPTQAFEFPILQQLPNGYIFGTDRQSLIRSTDEGQTWQFSAFGLTHGTIQDFVAFDRQNFLSLTPYGLWSTSNGSDSWELLIADTSNILLYSPIPLTDLILSINSDSFAVPLGNGIWASTDAGQNFSNIAPPGGIISSEINLTSDDWVICTGQQGVQIANKFSGNWSLSLPNHVATSFTEHKPSGKWFMLAYPDTTLNYRPILFVSSDHGQSWTNIDTFTQIGYYYYHLHADSDNRLYLTDSQYPNFHMAVSEDGGQSWDYQIIPTPYSSGDIYTNRMGHIFSPTYSDPLLTSVDHGESWYTLPPFGTYLRQPFIDQEGYLYVSNSQSDLIRTTKSTESGAYIYATLNRDADLDCSTPDAQEPLKNWNITVSGEEDYYGTTNANGYCTFYLDTAVYTVTARIPQALWWSLCDTVQTVEATQAMGSDTVPFVALPLAECPLMSVNVAASMLRRCFNNTVYINYCNQGTEPADSAWVDVMLDEYLSFISSAQPYDSLGNNVYRFYLGDVNSGDCGDFNLTVYVSCDSTVLGQTHCISAHIFPDTLCSPTPNWSGANIEASVVCQDTLIQFKLENTGQAPSGTLEYIIIEDDVVLFTGQKSYAPGESIMMDYDANGSTWRIESMQEPGHPFSNLALAFEEGCGGFESLGFINQFPVNGSSPSFHQTCIPNIGAFDPNDKQGFPNGVGEDHNIRPGQELEYLIRFQNTGTDTAFTVMIRDTLSAFLDPASVRPGASSHAYTWSLSGEGVITFTFNNIHLPDSNINEPASHGFVQFRIAQQPNLPLGSVIENDAAIYFDFNEPIITNTTWHTLYESPLTLATYEAGHSRKQQSLEIWPNPVKDQTNVRLKDASAGNKRVNLYNSTGQILQSVHFTGQETKLKCPSLPPGQYWIQVTDVQGRTLGSSVLVKE